jgi:signal transduction histidine kinase
MSTQLILITVILTTLFAVLFIFIINLSFKRKRIKKLNFKNVAIQLIMLTIWISILSDILLAQNRTQEYVSIAFFVASVIIGVFLIKNLHDEDEYQNTINKLIDKLQVNNEELKQLDKKKSEFVSLASHQLRGPLSVIQGYLSMVLEGDYGPLPEKSKEPIYRSLRSSKALSLLINDYLDVAQIERGEMEYNMDKIKLSNVLRDVVSEYEIVAEKSKLNFSFEDNTKNAKINADRNKIRQVLSNIIDNAIKYTENGYVKIVAEVEEENIIITVEDSGIGIKKDKVNEIFNKFARSEEAIRVNVVGTGLGLFVAKIMVESQDGNIWVKSDGIGKGSTFHISLPIAKDN